MVYPTFLSDRIDVEHMSAGAKSATHARNTIRYAAVAVVILAAWNFFAPFVGAPSWAPYLDVLPVIVGQTEADGFVNATHIVVLVVGAIVVMRV